MLAAQEVAFDTGWPGMIAPCGDRCGYPLGSLPRGISAKYSGLKSGANGADRYIAMYKCAGLLLLSALAVAGTRPRSLPLMFEANLGQAEPTTVFLGRGPGYAIHFDGDGISLVRGQDIVRMDLQGANSARISGNQPQEGRANYFIGNPDQWITDVPLYAGVQYRGVYPGVDLVFYSSKGELEYDFTLAPGVSASTIRLAFRGIDEMRIDGGDLVLKTGWGELRHRRPRIYQMRNGRRSEIAGRFVIRGQKEAVSRQTLTMRGAHW